MANKIYMDTELLEQLSSQIAQLQQSLSSVSDRVSRSVSEVRRVASGQTGIIQKLGNVQRNVQKTADRAAKLSRAASRAADRWKEAENRIKHQNLGQGEAGIGDGIGGIVGGVIGAGIGGIIGSRIGGIGGAYIGSKIGELLSDWFKNSGVGSAPNQLPLFGEAIAKFMKYNSDPSSWSQTMKDNFLEKVKDAEVFPLPGGEYGVLVGTNILVLGAGGMDVLSPSSSFTNLGLTSTHYGTDGSWKKDEWKLGLNGGWDAKLQVPDGKGGWKSAKIKTPDLGEPIDKMYGGKTKTDRLSELASVGVEHSKEGSVWHSEGKVENGLGSAEYSANALHGEAHASFKGGLYATKVDADGKVHYSLEPGIEAKIGGSFSVFDAKGSAQYGTDNLNVHANGEVTVGRVGAEAEGQLGFVDGKFNAHVGANAEAIAGEIKGSVGVNVAGIDANIGGSLNYGIGAHADVGYHDGTLHVDIGATLGVGGSIKADINIGGFVDNVANVVGDGVNAIKDFGGSIISGIGSLFG